MPRPKAKWPIGFVSPGFVIKTAKEKHHKVVLPPALWKALQSVPPEWVHVKHGKKRKYHVREDKLLEIIARTRGRAVIPEGHFTVAQVAEEARGLGIKVSRFAIYKKINTWLKQQEKIWAKNRNAPVREELEGITYDSYDKRDHRILLSRKSKDALLKWLRLSSVFPRLDYMTPVAGLAREFNVRRSTIHAMPGIRVMVVGTRAYLDEDNAKYAREYLAEGSHKVDEGKRPSKLVPPSGPIKRWGKKRKKKAERVTFRV